MKRLSFSIILIFLVIAVSDMPQARVTGQCSNCHTMHNSQGGAAMRWNESSTPFQTLLMGTCVGCHSDTYGSGTYKDSITGAPFVLSSSAGFGYDDGTYKHGLAAGNFYYCDTAAESVKGHNITSTMISSQEVDTNFTTPPGFKDLASDGRPSQFGGSGQWGPSSWASQINSVTCAGVYGCHGDRSSDKTDSYKGIKGAHHENDTTIDGNSVGTSYRFLAGIKGAELNSSGEEWECGPDSTHHNGYQGNSTYGTDDTISYLCAECHGNYHAHTDLGGTGQVGDSTPWLRHPTDFAFSGVRDNNYSGSEYATYTSYSILAPVAEGSPSTTGSTVSSGSIVMCLSCHRAHASPYYKLMRWDNKAGYSGCAVCHTTKG